MALFLLLFIIHTSLAMTLKGSEILIYRVKEPTMEQQKQDYLLIRSIRQYFARSHLKEMNEPRQRLKRWHRRKGPFLRVNAQVNVNGKDMPLNELLNQSWKIRMVCFHQRDCVPALALSLRDNVLSMVGSAMEDYLMDASSWDRFMDYSLLADTNGQSLLILTLPAPPLFDLIQSMEITSKVYLSKLKIIQHDTPVTTTMATTLGYLTHHLSTKVISIYGSVSWADLNKSLSSNSRFIFYWLDSMPPFFHIISKYPSSKSCFFQQTDSLSLEYQLHCT